MAKKQQQKPQRPARVQPDSTPKRTKRMPVTVRDPLSRRVVKRTLPMAEEHERELDQLHGLDGWGNW